MIDRISKFRNNIHISRYDRRLFCFLNWLKIKYVYLHIKYLKELENLRQQGAGIEGGGEALI